MRSAIIRGLLFGAVGLHLAVVGVLLMLHQRWIVIDTISLGQAVLGLIAVGAGVLAGPATVSTIKRMLLGLVAGVAASLPLAALTVAMDLVRLQSIFIALSHDLFEMLSLGLGVAAGVPVLIGSGALGGLAGAVLQRSSRMLRRAVIAGASAVVVAGVFQELIQLMLQFEGTLGDIRDFFYTWEGLSLQGAGVIFAAVAVASATRGRGVGPTTEQQRQRQRMIRALICLAGLAVLPALAGSYIGQVLMLVGLYILMGMGLNLEVGLAGLLDLGFVAFFAVGAYATAC